MSAASESEFERLLRATGAVLPGPGESKGVCPACGHRSLIIRLDHLDYRCRILKCRFFGSINTLRNMFSIKITR